ncbi:hypothetical protein, partial [Croceibacter atlanticus]|uniref:hypothetical protein n=1 Tax=Croceibacter atlanticus TaxID=313588 RepID=UPI0032B11A82
MNWGLLQTNKDQFSYYSPIEDSDVIVDSREQARSPKYTISTGFESQLTKKLFTHFEILTKDKYY